MGYLSFQMSAKESKVQPEFHSDAQFCVVDLLHTKAHNQPENRAELIKALYAFHDLVF